MQHWSINRKILSLPLACFAVMLVLACGRVPAPLPGEQSTPTRVPVGRTALIPVSAVKMSPGTDEHPPVMYARDYAQPVPLPGLVNTAGAEDSPFIMPDGKNMYFFFTPDVSVPVEKQLLDGMTGIYVSKKVGDTWDEGERVWLQEPNKLSLDGCELILGQVMWFCSTREGHDGIHWFTAEFVEGAWRNWKLADFDPSYQVGELHITAGGKELYFGSERPGGMGGLDIWSSIWVDGKWQEPVNVRAVNTSDGEGWPATNLAGDELWFTRNYGIWQSQRVGGVWQAAELVVSPLAGEPTLDGEGNLYFVHHFFSGERMIEADIYMAEKK